MTFQTTSDLPIAGVSARGNESPFSGVSWAAIIAGGVISAAMALILTSLGAGLGLLALSPWRADYATIGKIGTATIIWSVVVEVVAFGIGGYVAGRLRTKWATLHGDEVYFRDTAHGFVVWALGTLISASLITSAIGAVGHGAVTTAATVAGTGAGVAGLAVAHSGTAPDAGGAGESAGPIDYFTDMMLRPAATSANSSQAAMAPSGSATSDTSQSIAVPDQAETTAPGEARRSQGEVSRILVQSLASGSINPADKGYLAQIVSSRTGMSMADAQKRVDDVTGQLASTIEAAKQKAKEAADTARKALAALALWGFVSMLIGAFAASYAASRGGRARDLY